MNPCLVQFYDSRSLMVADITRDTATHFATTYGLDYVCESTASYPKKPHMKKVELTLRELNAGRPYVVYADVDIVFIKDLPADFLSSFTGSMSVFFPLGSMETSFFIAYNTDETKAFFTRWLEVGMADRAANDDDSFFRLYMTVAGVKGMMRPIPISYISTPMGGAEETVGRHFYASSMRGTYQMRNYKRRRFDEITSV